MVRRQVLTITITSTSANSSTRTITKVHMVRRGEFGKMGQTKWTHLTAEDTSKTDSPWAQVVFVSLLSRGWLDLSVSDSR